MKHILTIAFLLFAFASQAQNQLIKGRIVDSNSQEGIAYTNIGIEGTFYGTASDADGFFELKIPDEFADKVLFVSAVGYSSKSLSVPELLQKDFARIAIDEQTYSIEGIDVAAQSRVLYRIIRTASDRVSENYHAGPIGLKFHYLERVNDTDSIDKIREAVVELTDEHGYSSPSVQDAYISRNYRFTEVNKNFDSFSFKDGTSRFNELIDLDLPRLSNTIFNDKLINDYDLHLDGIQPYKGDSVWVISYKSAKPGLAHSGDYYATQLEGKLYINKKNYALVRHECMIEAEKNNPQHRSLYTSGNAEKNVRYHYTALYQPYGGKYLVSYLDLDKRFENEQGQTITETSKAALLDLDRSPKAITGRTYFEDSEYNEKFWTSFHSSKKL